MTRDDAMQRGRRLYGDKFRYRVERVLSSPEKRAEARRQYDEVQAQLNTLRKQALPLVKQARELERAASHYRFWIYEKEPLGHWVRGKGDTWEEAFTSIGLPSAAPARPAVREGGAA